VGAVGDGIGNFRMAQTFEPSREVFQNILLSMNYLPKATARDVFDEHRRWGEAHGGGALARMYAHGNDPSPDRKLKVGYLSADLRQHPVASFLAPLLAAHDRGQVEVRCYASVASPDGTTARLQAMADAWVPVQAMSDEQVARKIREDQVDILVELGGHTEESRLPVLAQRPAPVQISWLGYPGTTGLTEVDYRLTDGQADPESAAPFYTERLLRLDRCFLCYEPPGEAPAVGPLPCGEGAPVTFGSFNNLAKINEQVIEVWARLLKKVPGSRLLLKAGPLVDAGARARFEKLFAAQGVEPARLELMGRIAGVSHHLDVYNRVDIALDPFPYNGTTTTCEALWMGVPVVTLEGERHAGRVGADLLRAVGHPELIAAKTKNYVELAARLASDRARLAGLRAGLRGEVGRSPLTDARGFAAAVEGAYRSAWQGWCAQAGGEE